MVLARVLRSGVEESVHLGSVAVADADGRIVAEAGDPLRPVFARSASKPFQAAVSLDLAGDALTDRELAVMAASHGGEAVHVEAVRAILARASMDEGALRCPPAWPLDEEAARGAAGPAAVLHQCSGTHAGMLLASARAGLDPATYPEPSHPLQERIGEAISAAAGAGPLGVGVDGCGIPVHRLPLAALATAYARLGRPDRLGALGRAAARLAESMRAEPYLVAGRRRLCTSLMESASGLLVKTGAEGIACAGLIDRGWGVALKIEDGAPRAERAALVRALALLDAIDPTLPEVAPHARPPVVGGGRVVGAVESTFTLR